MAVHNFLQNTLHTFRRIKCVEWEALEVVSFPHAGCERRAERTAGEDQHIKSQRKWRKQVVGAGGTVGRANSAAV